MIWKTHTTLSSLPYGEFLKGDKADRVDLITGGYKTNRYLTLEVLRRIPFEELKELLPFLMSHARSVHAYLGHVREIIFEITKRVVVGTY